MENHRDALGITRSLIIQRGEGGQLTQSSLRNVGERLIIVLRGKASPYEARRSVQQKYRGTEEMVPSESLQSTKEKSSCFYVKDLIDTLAFI